MRRETETLGREIERREGKGQRENDQQQIDCLNHIYERIGRSYEPALLLHNNEGEGGRGSKGATNYHVREI